MNPTGPGSLELLQQASSALDCVHPDDLATVADAGGKLEEMAADLPADDACAPVLIGMALEVLQRLYEGTSSAPEAELQAACAVLRAGGQSCAEADGGDAVLSLWVLLGHDPADFPLATTGDTAAAPSPASLDDLLGSLIAIQPEDTMELQRIQSSLSALAAQQQWPLPAVEPAQAALAQAVSAPSAAALEQAVTALAALVEEPAAPAEATPAEPVPASTGSSAELTCCELAGDVALLEEFVAEARDHLQTAEAALLDLEANPGDRESLNAVFRAFHTIKGAAGFLGLPDIQKLSHHAESLLDSARSGDLLLTGPNADLILRSADMLKTMLNGLAELHDGNLPPAPAGLSELIEQLASPDAATAASAPSGAPDEAPPAAAAQKHREQGETTIRVRTDRLDALINMVGELVIANAMLVQDEVVQTHQARALGRKVSEINKITRELQAVGTSMRMVPLKSTFQKMARLVRDVAHKSGKLVQFVTDGEETEIDRNMVEALGDPLLHMIRNAVDHGIESPAERQAAGKPETGTVTLRAYHAADNIVIELSDDGKGLDAERILAKAVATGVVEEGRDLTQAEIYRLIFAAGLSTAAKITDVSGRGVGMDVVARNIEALKGRVDIASTLGQGSTFTVRIPLTLAIMDGMLVRVGSERYLIPTISIQQAVQPDAQSLSTVFGQTEMVMFQERLVPIVRLHRLFELQEAIIDPCQALLVVAEYEGGQLALMVDELLGQQQIVIKSLGSSLRDLPGVSGSAILGDGRVGLILDLPGLQQLIEQHEAAAVA